MVTNYYTVVTEENQQILSDWRGHALKPGYIVGRPFFIDSSKAHNQKPVLKGSTYDFGIELSFEEFCRRENIKIVHKKINLILW